MIFLFVGVVLCVVSWWLVFESLSTLDHKQEVVLGALAVLFMALGLASSIIGLGGI